MKVGGDVDGAEKRKGNFFKKLSLNFEPRGNFCC